MGREMMDPLCNLPQLSPDATLDQAQSTGTLRACLITLGGRSFAIDLGHVREVFKLESITPVPGMPATLVGVANLRGTIIPLADLRSTLGTSIMADVQKYAVIVRHGGQQVGILIDEVPEIRTIDIDDLSAPSVRDAAADHPFLSRVFKAENNVRGMLEVSRLLDSVEEVSGDARVPVHGKHDGSDGATGTGSYLGR